MQVSVESTSNLGRKMKVEVPNERIDAEVEKRLNSMKGSVKISGFRPGKVPEKVVRQRYGKEVFREVVGEMMRTSYQEAVVQEKLRPAGNPEIEANEAEPGKGLTYTASFDVYPEFEVAPVDSIEVKRPQVEIQEEDITRVIDNIRRQQQTWENVERAAQRGDKVVMDYKGNIDGEAFEGGEGENMPVELGAGVLIAGFEDQLEGMSAGDEKTFSTTFPDDYQNTSLAGKTAEFTVKLSSVSEGTVPDIDDDFCRKFGIEAGGEEALRKEVKDNMQRELDQRVRSKVKEQVTEGLLETNNVEVPEALIKLETSALREQTMSNMQSRANAESLDESMFPDEIFADQAKKRVALGLIMTEIVKSNEIKLDNDRLDTTLNQLAANYDEPQQVISYYRNNREMMSNIESMVIEDQVVDWVMERCKVTDEPDSYDNLLNPGSNQAST